MWGAVNCASLHLREIRPGTLRENHRHYTCNETFVIWGVKQYLGWRIMLSIEVMLRSLLKLMRLL
ncbi:hypothetical protein CsSME_00002675 [Camellia sinensis var. sinensis]